MNIIVRLYWQHDLDLVALNMHPDFDMGKWMKKAVVAFAKGDEGFTIPLPRPIPYHVQLESCSTHFALVPGKDDDIIACMNGFRYGQRNSAIKNIFRMYLETPYFEPYYNEKMYSVKARGAEKELSERNNTKTVKPVAKPRKTVSKVNKENFVAPEVKTTVSEQIEELSCMEDKFEKPISISETVDYKSESRNISSSFEDETDSSESSFDLFGALNDMMNM